MNVKVEGTHPFTKEPFTAICWDAKYARQCRGHVHVLTSRANRSRKHFWTTLPGKLVARWTD